MSETESWPAVDPERLADTVAELAGRVAEPDLRAQLHALAGLVRNLPGAPVDAARAPLAHELADALAGDDESRTIAAARALTRFDRERVRAVDWRAASGD